MSGRSQEPETRQLAQVKPAQLPAAGAKLPAADHSPAPGAKTGAEIAIELANQAKTTEVATIPNKPSRNGQPSTDVESLGYRTGTYILVASKHEDTRGGQTGKESYSVKLYDTSTTTRGTPIANLTGEEAKQVFDVLKGKKEHVAQVIDARTSEVVADLTGPRNHIKEIDWKKIPPGIYKPKETDLHLSEKNGHEIRAYYRGLNIRAAAEYGKSGADDPASKYQVRVNDTYISGDKAKELFNAIKKTQEDQHPSAEPTEKPKTTSATHNPATTPPSSSASATATQPQRTQELPSKSAVEKSPSAQGAELKIAAQPEVVRNAVVDENFNGPSRFSVRLDAANDPAQRAIVFANPRSELLTDIKIGAPTKAPGPDGAVRIPVTSYTSKGVNDAGYIEFSSRGEAEKLVITRNDGVDLASPYERTISKLTSREASQATSSGQKAIDAITSKSPDQKLDAAFHTGITDGSPVSYIVTRDAAGKPHLYRADLNNPFLDDKDKLKEIPVKGETRDLMLSSRLDFDGGSLSYKLPQSLSTEKTQLLFREGSGTSALVQFQQGK